jgi:hypothetical protein
MRVKVERDGMLDMGEASRCVDVRAMSFEGLLRGTAKSGSRASPPVIAEDGEDTMGPYGPRAADGHGNVSRGGLVAQTSAM